MMEQVLGPLPSHLLEQAAQVDDEEEEDEDDYEAFRVTAFPKQWHNRLKTAVKWFRGGLGCDRVARVYVWP